MATAKKTELVEIRPLEMVETKIRIVGDTPLIVHAWSAKAKREILYNEVFGKKLGKSKREPLADFVSAAYWLTPMPTEFDEETVYEALKTARFGFPVTGIKQASVAAAYRSGWTKDMASVRGTFFIVPEYTHYYGGDLLVHEAKKEIEIVPNVQRPEQLVEIHSSDVPQLREDPVRVGNGNSDLRYRPQFEDWYADLTIRYNANGTYRLDQILSMIQAGGQLCGIGEWRPEKDGQYGQFHIENVK